MYLKIKRRIYQILEIANPDDKLSKIFDVFIILLISLNVIAVILETVDSISIKYSTFLRIFEIFSIAIFTTEYFLRLICCPVNKKFKHPVFGRLRFALTPLIFIDLISILPFYLPMFTSFDMRFIRGIRLFRLTRLLKIGRYSSSLRTLINVLKRKKEELIISVFSIFILLIIVSSLMYFIEHKAQPEAFSSIPASMWWGIITLTTVGYGDVYPVTIVGKLYGSFIAFLGIGLFALPAGILASGFTEEIHQSKVDNSERCPHCGKSLK